MKFQHVSIMFVLIFIPILLVTSYFINLQVKTIRMESSYNDKLLKSTYDAMRAFELNTANEDLSAVSDSLRSIIDASTNIFFNTLCTNLGVSNASKSYIQPYIPAILYTLYDGYYIYCPTNLAQICVDSTGQTIRTSDYGVSFKKTVSYGSKTCGIYEFDESSIHENTLTGEKSGDTVNYTNLVSNGIEQEYGQILYKNNDGTYSTELHVINTNYPESTYYKRSYILKSYIPYSARYSDDSSYDITINYTLDNFMTIEGTIGGVYYTKSGYLTEKDLVQEININGTIVQGSSWSQISEDVVKEYINSPEYNTVSIKLSDGTEISNQMGKVEISVAGSGNQIVYWDDALDALEYYVGTFMFSNWFYENLSGVQASNLRNTQYSVADVTSLATISGTAESITGEQTRLLKDMLHDFSTDSSTPFKPTDGTFDNDPENLESYFYVHKRNIIKNSITYNLILSMLVYTEESRTVDFDMPVFSETEWDLILNNISIVSFMEGFKCGLKYFNSYAIVTSTNNEITVTDNEIYYVSREIEGIDEDGDGTTDYQILASLEDNDVFETSHRIDCKDLILHDSTKNFQNLSDGTRSWLGCISFKSKEIKYDKILNKDGTFTYDHKAYTDYNCIVDSNYSVKTRSGDVLDGNTEVLDYLIDNKTSISGALNLDDEYDSKLEAYRIAIAKERNNLYKTTAFSENYGWDTTVGDNLGMSVSISPGKNFKLSEIFKIDLTIEDAENSSPGVYTDLVSITCNGNPYGGEQTIATTSKSRRTLEFKEDLDNNSSVSSVNIGISSANGTSFKVVGAKIYLK